MTEKYPDICQMVLAMLLRPLPANRASFPANASEPSASLLDLMKVENVDSFIMDAEVVAIDKTTGAYRTFQELTNRAKKDVRVEDIKVVVGIFAFDLMLLNDEVSAEPPYHSTRKTDGTSVSHYSAHHSLIAGTCSEPCSRLSPPLLTPSSRGSTTSSA